MTRKSREVETVEIQGVLMQETDKAYLIAVDNDKECWVPKSQVSNEQISARRDEISGDIPVWLAEKIGIA